MKDYELSGKLVYLTVHYDRWLREVNSDFNIPMVNRIARIIKVFDWDSEEGILLHAARQRSKKWGNFNPKDFKFVLRVYCPELKTSDKQQGFTVEEVSPRYYPSTDLRMFEVIPNWMLDQLKTDECKSFSIIPKKFDTSSSKNGSTKKKVVKKTVKKKNVSR